MKSALPFVLPFILLARCSPELKPVESHSEEDPTIASSPTALSRELTLEGFLEALTDTFCSSIEPCCMNGGVSYDEAGCRTTMSKYAQQVSTGYTLDEGQAQTCLANLGAAIDRCALNPEVMDALRPCSKAIIPNGTKELGEACSSPSDCKPSSDPSLQTYCAYTSAEGGVCRAFGEGKIGDACGQTTGHTTYACPADAYCPSGTPSPLCTARIAGGESCAADAWSCAVGHYCDANRVCAPTKQSGESCDPATFPSQCGTWASCNPASAVCQDLTLANPVTCGTQTGTQSGVLPGLDR